MTKHCNGCSNPMVKKTNYYKCSTCFREELEKGQPFKLKIIPPRVHSVWMDYKEAEFYIEYYKEVERAVRGF